MNTVAFWIQAAIQSTVAAAIVAVIAKFWLDWKIAWFQAKLKQGGEEFIERLRNDLRLKTLEREIRFRSIHEKRAEFLVEVFGCLHRLHAAAASYIAIFEPAGIDKSEKLAEFVKQYEAFRNNFYPRRILVAPQTRETIQKLGDRYAEIANRFTHGLRRDQMRGHTDTDHWEEAAKRFESEIPPLLNAVDSEFQVLLGVEGLLPDIRHST